MGIHQQSSQTKSGEKAEEPRALTAAKATWEVEKSKELVGVRGWLMFFVIAQVFISPIYAGIHLAELIEILKSAPDGEIKNWFTFFACTFALLTFFGFFVGIQIWRIKSDAIKHAKIYLKSAVLLNIFWALVFFYKWDLVSEAVSIIPSVLISVLWHIYMDKSARVRNTFG